MKVLKAIFNNIFVKNFLLAALIICVLTLGILWGLNIYTHHGDAVTVPDIKGLQMKEAIPLLEHAHLRYEVDSTHVKNARPGSIVEIVPHVGSKVKTNRIVFISINSFSVETLVLPEVKDLSQRQAMALLKSAGFENIQIKSVPSPYKDLVIGLEYNGREVKSGDKVPVVGNLVLKVCSGEEEGVSEDSLGSEQTTLDSWF